MIKINMLKGLKLAGAEAGARIDSVESSGVDFTDNNKRGALMLFGLFVIPGLLYYYQENQIRSKYIQELARVRSELSRINQENSEASTIATQVEDIQKQIEKIKQRKQAIVDLSRDRQLNVQVLDTIQTLIPEKVWLDKVAIKDGVINISGFAFNDSLISGFMSTLDESVFFDTVNLVRAEEVKLNTGMAKSFEVRSQIRGGRDD